MLYPALSGCRQAKETVVMWHCHPKASLGTVICRDLGTSEYEDEPVSLNQARMEHTDFLAYKVLTQFIVSHRPLPWPFLPQHLSPAVLT